MALWYLAIHTYREQLQYLQQVCTEIDFLNKGFGNKVTNKYHTIETTVKLFL